MMEQIEGMLVFQFLEFVVEPEPSDTTNKNHYEVKRLRAKADFKRRLSWPRETPHNHVVNFLSHAVNLICV
jgi:hypothetical protein